MCTRSTRSGDRALEYTQMETPLRWCVRAVCEGKPSRPRLGSERIPISRTGTRSFALLVLWKMIKALLAQTTSRGGPGTYDQLLNESSVTFRYTRLLPNSLRRFTDRLFLSSSHCYVVWHMDDILRSIHSRYCRPMPLVAIEWTSNEPCVASRLFACTYVPRNVNEIFE